MALVIKRATLDPEGHAVAAAFEFKGARRENRAAMCSLKWDIDELVVEVPDACIVDGIFVAANLDCELCRSDMAPYDGMAVEEG